MTASDNSRGRRVAASRREILLGGLCACCLPRGGQAAQAFALEEVGPGILIRRGPHEEATAENADGIANIGFIVGRDGVLVTSVAQEGLIRPLQPKTA